MSKGKSNKEITQAQQDVRDRFREATRYAKDILLDPKRKIHYTERARNQQLPNAYIAAVTEYLRATPLVKVMGNVKRAVNLPQVQTRAIKPVIHQPKVTRTSKPRKANKRSAVAVYMPGFAAGIICSENVKIKKVFGKRTKSGGIVFGATFLL